MKLSSKELASKLKQAIPTHCCLFGDEPLLVQETLQQLETGLKDKGYAEREVLHIDQPGQWSTLAARYYEQSLFAALTRLVIYCPKGNVGKPGSTVLKQLLQQPNTSKCLILVCDNLLTKHHQSAWMKAFVANGWAIQCPNINKQQFKPWLRDRLRQAQVQLTPEALSQFEDELDGNVLASAQAIARLQLYDNKRPITQAILQNEIVAHRQTTLYEFADHTLAGNLKKWHQSLAQLERDGVEPILILWILTKSCRELAMMAHDKHNGANPEAVMRKHNVWQSRTAIIRAALKHPVAHWHRCLQIAHQLDKQVKGLLPGNIWQSLHAFAKAIGGDSEQWLLNPKH